MKAISENLKNMLLLFVKAAVRVVSFYSSATFFLILLLNEAYKGEKDSVLEEKLTNLQEKIELLPDVIFQPLALTPDKKAESVFH